MVLFSLIQATSLISLQSQTCSPWQMSRTVTLHWRKSCRRWCLSDCTFRRRTVRAFHSLTGWNCAWKWTSSSSACTWCLCSSMWWLYCCSGEPGALPEKKRCDEKRKIELIQSDRFHSCAVSVLKYQTINCNWCLLFTRRLL